MITPLQFSIMSETVEFESETTRHLEAPKDAAVVVMEVLMIFMIAAEFVLRLWVAPLHRSFRVLDRIRRASLREGRDPWDEIDACGGCCCLHVTGCGRRTREAVARTGDMGDEGGSESDTAAGPAREVTAENFLRMQHNAFHDQRQGKVGCVACNCSQMRAATVDNACAARMQFLLWPGTLLDIVCLAPFLLWITGAEDIFGTSVFANFLRILRAVRVLKFARYSPAVTILAQVIALKADTLVVAVVISATCVMLVAVAVFVAERNVNAEEYPNMVASLWWAVITLTTVGYGDVAPVTPLGRLFGAIAALLGVLFFTLPPAVISTGFVEFREAQKEQQYQKLATLIALKRRTLLRHGFMRIIRQTRNAAEIADGVFERLDVLDGSYVVAKTRTTYVSVPLSHTAVRAAEASAALSTAQPPPGSQQYPPSPSFNPTMWNSQSGPTLRPPPFGSRDPPSDVLEDGSFDVDDATVPYLSLAPLAPQRASGGADGAIADSSDSESSSGSAKGSRHMLPRGDVDVQLVSHISVVRCDVLQAWRDVLRNPPTFSAAAVRPGCPAREVVQERLDELAELQERQRMANESDSSSDSYGGEGGVLHEGGGGSVSTNRTEMRHYSMHVSKHGAASQGKTPSAAEKFNDSKVRPSAKGDSPRGAKGTDHALGQGGAAAVTRGASRPRSARQRLVDSFRSLSARGGSPTPGGATSLNTAAAGTVLSQMRSSQQSIASLLAGRELLVTATWVFGFDAVGHDLLELLLQSRVVVAPHLQPPLGGLPIRTLTAPAPPCLPRHHQRATVAALMDLPAVPRTAPDGSHLTMDWSVGGPRRHGGRASMFKRSNSGAMLRSGRRASGSMLNDDTPRLAAETAARVVIGGSGHCVFQDGVFGVDLVGPLDRVIAPFLPTYSIRQALRSWGGTPFSPFGGALRQDEGGFIWVDASVVGEDAAVSNPSLEALAGGGLSPVESLAAPLSGASSLLQGGAGGVSHALVGLSVRAREALVQSVMHLITAGRGRGGGETHSDQLEGGPAASSAAKDASAQRRLVEAADALLRAAGGDMDAALAAVLAARTAARSAGGEGVAAVRYN